MTARGTDTHPVYGPAAQIRRTRSDLDRLLFIQRRSGTDRRLTDRIEATDRRLRDLCAANPALTLADIEHA